LKIGVLTSPGQWFVKYAQTLVTAIGNDTKLLFDHKELSESFDILFILSYHKIIPESYLKKNRHNIVVHASDLPKGKGWAPMFWQILEGKNEIPFTMFEASTGIDNGDIYLKKVLHLNGYELNNELRKKQANFIIEMCLDFIKNYDNLKIPTPQKGVESFYPKRTPKNSQLNLDKTIREQFNLLRIVDNEEYPAFFEIDGHKYYLKIEKDDS